MYNKILLHRRCSTNINSLLHPSYIVMLRYPLSSYMESHSLPPCYCEPGKVTAYLFLHKEESGDRKNVRNHETMILFMDLPFIIYVTLG